jgi:DNA-binding transcriptional LysR family regulator
MDERFDGIMAFVRAAELGSFARAAERLAVTRSAVAKQIARLEQRLGVRLFARSTRTQALTEAGRTYYERCKRALAELDAAEHALAGSGREPRGTLKVTAPLLFGRKCVAPVLYALCNRYAKLALQMALTDRRVDLVGEGFDLAVRFGDLPDSSTLTARTLGRQQFVACASAAYLARHGVPRKVADLAGHTGILYGNSEAPRQWMLDAGPGERQPAAFKRAILLDDVEAIADAALAGVGVARLPRWLVRPMFEAGTLTPLLQDLHSHHNAVSLVWVHGREPPPKTRLAIEALAAAVPALLGA